MLVGSRMEDIVRPEGAEDVLHTCTAADTGHYHLAGHIREILGHHEADIMLGRLRLVYEHHLLRLEAGNLSDDFHTDGAGGTGNQNALAGELFLYRLHVHTDLLTRQKIFHTHLLDLHAGDIILLQDTILHTRLLGA